MAGHRRALVGDPFGERRIDAIKDTGETVPALRTCQVVTTPLALSASDHLLVAVDDDRDAIAER